MQSGERYAKEKNMKVLTEISPDDDAESAVNIPFCMWRQSAQAKILQSIW